jgi:large subunit ribosomal protein L25
VQHIDFLRIRADRVFQVSVPIHFHNEDTAPGVKLNGGNMVQSITELEVSCLPAALPEFVELDVGQLDIGDILHISDIKLPEGVTSVALALGEDYDAAVVTVAAPRAEVEEEPEESSDDASDDAGEAGDEPAAED